MATGILLPSCSSSLSSSSPHSSASSSSSRTSRTSLNSSASTSKQVVASHPRRIRFAPLPDPRRAVLITDDGNELPIELPTDNDLNHIPTSLLILSPPASPLPPLNEIRTDTSDERENSSGSSYTSSTSASSTSTPRTTTPSDVSPISSLTSSPVTANSALPATKCTPPLLTSQKPPPSSWPKPRSISKLLPFKRPSTSSSSSSSHSLTPTNSIEAPGQGHAQTSHKTVATLNLFRTSSRESTDSTSTATTSGWGLGLSRWTSANNTEKPNAVLSGSSPLARTQSTQSYKSKAKTSLFSTSSSSLSSESKSVSQPAAPKAPGQSRHKGARMLNGRVYGSKRPSTAPNANPFANARDEDVEFVEWGYGGMGSVKGAKSAGMAGGSGVNWERLQGGASTRQGVGGSFGGASVDDDGDDGSGMGWVKKRKEERERKKREEEEKAAKEKEEREKEPQQMQSEQEVTESAKSTPTPTRTSTMDGLTSIKANEAEEEGPTSAATIVPSSFNQGKEEVAENANTNAKGELKEGFVFGGAVVDEPMEQEREKEHMPVVVPVPVRPRHHHHHSSHSHRHGRTLSKDALLDEGVCDRDHEDAVAVVPAVEHQDGEREKRDSISSASTSESESETEDEEGGDEQEDEDEEDEDEDEEDESKVVSGRKPRKTALGAGVEKVSRHKE